jgi:hypothetical protein|tara:strand:- start:30 stop:428 length:399 start_codon:yes stop_codon:yes gene_type:complete
MPRDEYEAHVGSTLLIPSGPDEKRHLYFVLTDKCSEEKHLLIGISSVPEAGFFDETCLIEPNEHPFVQHKSYAFYRKPEVYSAKKLSRYVGLNYFVVKEDASSVLIERMREGLLVSDFTPRFYQKYFEAQVM